MITVTSPLPRGLNAGHHHADLGPQTSHNQLLAAGGLHDIDCDSAAGTIVPPHFLPSFSDMEWDAENRTKRLYARPPFPGILGDTLIGAGLVSNYYFIILI